MKRSLIIAIAIMATTLIGATTTTSAPAAGGALAPASTDNVSCADLTSLSITAGTVTHAEVVDAGTFTPPVAPGGRTASRAS